MNKKNLNIDYKNHIQSLRAISVLLVFFYHLKIDLFQKGFLGVDIFFVISGFVITQSLYSDYLKKNKIDLIHFFSKRIKRILPNLLFITTSIYLFFLIFGPPNISKWLDYLSSIFGISNFYFLFSDKGYFYNIFDNPFAHTWSLGVEEQFYFIYPFFLFLIFKFLKNKINNSIYFLSFLILLSLLSSLYFFFIDPDFTFYFSPLRFWEIGFGCLCFLISKNIKENYLISLLSLITIFLTIFINFNFFYLLNNIIIVFFSGLFIIFYTKNIIFENKIFIQLGKISYSFYLWHLPIIFFINIYLDNKIILILLSLFLSFLLSLFTYNFIEKPFINFKKRKVILVKFLILFLICIISLVSIKKFYPDISYKIRDNLYKINYLEKKYKWKKRVTFQSIYINDKEIHKYCSNVYNNAVLNKLDLNINCLKHNNYEYLFFIEGNSHTAQFINPLNQIKFLKNIYFTSANNNFISEELISNISKHYKKIFYVTDINNIDKLNKIINTKIFNLENIEFIFFNSTPFIYDNLNPQYCLSRHVDCHLSKETDYNIRSLFKLNKELLSLQKVSNKVHIFNSYQSLCPIEKCTIYDKSKDILFYMDKTHLSSEGSLYLQNNLEKFLLNKIRLKIESN
jgi:peptidoglycan/LPS O-acetylase OafA/YrhL